MAPNPLSIVLIRHAVSLANVDPAIYATTPDHAVPLASPDDDSHALSAGQVIASLGHAVTDVCSWSSSYVRCKQTETLVMGRAFGDAGARIRRRESFLLREQEFGEWDGLLEKDISERYPELFEKRRRLADMQGRFYFRFPNGESRADVVQRIAIFIGKLHRSDYPHHVVFLHGVTQRAFRMAWFDRPPEWFEEEPNPRPASVLIIRRDENGRWQETYLQNDGPQVPPAVPVVP